MRHIHNQSNYIVAIRPPSTLPLKINCQIVEKKIIMKLLKHSPCVIESTLTSGYVHESIWLNTSSVLSLQVGCQKYPLQLEEEC